MKRLTQVIALVTILALATSAFAAVGTKKDGTYTGEATTIDFIDIGKGTVTKSGGEVDVDFNDYRTDKTVVVESDTPDTLTAAEGGTTFIATSEAAGGRQFDLPVITASNNGLWYEIIGGPSTTEANRELIVHAQDGASIFLTGKGTAGASVRALTGDVGSDSYPTIKVVAYDGNWFVMETKGTWATGS